MGDPIPLADLVRYRFDQFNFRRWILACQLYKGLAPDISLLG